MSFSSPNAPLPTSHTEDAKAAARNAHSAFTVLSRLVPQIHRADLAPDTRHDIISKLYDLAYYKSHLAFIAAIRTGIEAFDLSLEEAFAVVGLEALNGEEKTRDQLKLLSEAFNLLALERAALDEEIRLYATEEPK